MKTPLLTSGYFGSKRPSIFGKWHPEEKNINTPSQATEMNLYYYFDQPITAVSLLIFLLFLFYYCNTFKKHLAISTERHLIYYEIIHEIKEQLLESVSGVIILSSGALLLGISFITSSSFRDSESVFGIYLLLSWVLFVSSIIFGILFRISLIKFYIRWITEVQSLYNPKHKPAECPQRDETELERHERESDLKNKQDEVYTYFNKYTFNFEALNIITFLIAVIFLAIFVISNF